MAAPKKFTDDDLRHYLNMDFSHAEIARLFHVSEAAITQRVQKLERGAAVKQPAVVTEALASVFDTRAALQENYKACYTLLRDPDIDAVQVRTLILKHIQEGLKVVDKLYQLSEQQAFQEEVLTILEECEPGTRQRILERIQHRRSVRAAFTGSTHSISE